VGNITQPADRPADRDDSFSPLIAFVASKTPLQVRDARVVGQAEAVHHGAGGDHQIVAAPALDMDEITRSEIAYPGFEQCPHVGCPFALRSRAANTGEGAFVNPPRR
jgi:hypothetical protein